MTEGIRVDKIIKLLEEEYKEPLCTLEYRKDYELLFATRLAAQCTDARVNKVTPKLFSRYTTLEALASADISDLEALIHSCGFFRAKARDISACAALLIEQYGGKVPDTMEELLKLPGVGRKTANLILGDIYGKPAVVCDTHCIRIANRLGLAESKDPYRVELSLASILPEEKQNAFCHRMVFHGRAVCLARSPLCNTCILNSLCERRIDSYKNTNSQIERLGN